MRKIVIGITAPLSVVLLKGQLNYFSNLGYKVYLMAPKTYDTLTFCKKEKAILLPVNIKREISPISDFKALIKIFFYLKRIKPDIINVGTPKMGLLGSIAGWMVGIPKRFYTCRGFRFEHESGFKRLLLMQMDRLAIFLSNQVICISHSVEELGIKKGIFKKEKSVVLGNGSSNGLDLDFFNPNKYNSEFKSKLKIAIGANGKFIFGFVGRIIDRKGINELYKAFSLINKDYPNTHLLIVGKANLEQLSDKTLINKLENDINVTLTGYVDNVNDYMAIMDIFVLPAWWEGFGNSLIQAAAMGLPIISCDVTGCKDAVLNGYNGILIVPKQVQVLKNTMIGLMNNYFEMKRLGENGKRWARRFDSKIIWSELKKLYER